MKKTFFSIFLLLLFANCKKIIEIDFPELEQKIVINSLFCPDSVFTVNISKTTDFNDSNVYFLDNVNCKLYADEEFIFDLQYQDNGFYVAPNNYKPIIGVKYKIEVSHSELPSVWAENSIPTYKPIISNIEIQDSAILTADETDPYLSRVNFDFFDKTNEINFYEYFFLNRSDSIYFESDTIITYWGDTIINAIHFNSHTYFSHIRSNDPIISNENLLDYYPKKYPFSDNLLNNVHNFEFHFYPITYRTSIFDEETYEYNDTTICSFYTLFLHIRSVSEAYYNYRKKLILHTNNQVGDIWTGTGSPVQMYSNVHNGYGIFAGYQEVVDSARNY